MSLFSKGLRLAETFLEGIDQQAESKLSSSTSAASSKPQSLAAASEPAQESSSTSAGVPLFQGSARYVSRRQKGNDTGSGSGAHLSSRSDASEGESALSAATAAHSSAGDSGRRSSHSSLGAGPAEHGSDGGVRERSGQGIVLAPPAGAGAPSILDTTDTTDKPAGLATASATAPSASLTENSSNGSSAANLPSFPRKPSLSEQLQQLSSEDLRTALLQKEASVRRLMEEAAETSEVMTRLSAEKAAAELEAAELDGLLIAAQDRIDRLTGEKERLQQENSKLVERAEALEGQVKEAYAELQTSRRQQDSLRSELRGCDVSAVEALQEELAEARELVSRLQQEAVASAASHSSSLQSLQMELSQTQEGKDTATAELQMSRRAAQRREEDLTAQVAELQRALAASQASADAQSAALQRLQQQIGQLNGQQQQGSEESGPSLSSSSLSRSYLSKSSSGGGVAGFSSSSSPSPALLETLSSLEATLAAERQQTAVLKVEVSQLQQRLQEVQASSSKQHAADCAALAVKEQALQRLAAELAQAQERLQGQTDAAALEERLSSLAKALAARQEAMVRLQSELQSSLSSLQKEREQSQSSRLTVLLLKQAMRSLLRGLAEAGLGLDSSSLQQWDASLEGMGRDGLPLSPHMQAAAAEVSALLANHSADDFAFGNTEQSGSGDGGPNDASAAAGDEGAEAGLVQQLSPRLPAALHLTGIAAFQPLASTAGSSQQQARGDSAVFADGAVAIPMGPSTASTASTAPASSTAASSLSSSSSSSAPLSSVFSTPQRDGKGSSLLHGKHPAEHRVQHRGAAASSALAGSRAPSLSVVSAVTPLSKLQRISNNKSMLQVANMLDAFFVRSGQFLFRHPTARLAVLGYLALLHAWCLFLLLFHTHALPHEGHAFPRGGIISAPGSSGPALPPFVFKAGVGEK